MPFPDEIVSFPTMENVSASDGSLIAQYQQAVENQDMVTAARVLAQIPNYDKKIITAQYLNSIATTVHALELYFLQDYSSSLIVSASQPLGQHVGDMWFQITGA